MAGFDDLIVQSQPALVGGGTRNAGGTAGKPWLWRIADWVDMNGDPLDLAPASGVQGVCIVWDKATEDNVIQLTYDGGLGWCSIAATGVATTGTDLGQWFGRECAWGFYLEKDANPEKRAQIWIPGNSNFSINRGS